MTDVRISEDHRADIYLRHFDNVPDEIWTEPGDYGDSRRKRLKPTAIAVTWRRRNDEPWQLASLSVMGTYQHARSDSGMSVRYVDGLRTLRPIEPWITDLIDLAHPAKLRSVSLT
jgi:predicted transcriptional regulator